MLRAALTAFVLASVAGAVACGSGTSSGPAVVAGAAAGDVVEVSGAVTATRDGTPRPVAAGDVISGDDVIETGADGRVTITLRHNRVAWTLGPGKKEQVGASLAWRAPTASQTAAGPTGERSGAAGRHAEREAADTAATADMEVAMAPPAAAAAQPPVTGAPAPGAAPMPDPVAPPERAVTRGAVRDDHAADRAAAEEARAEALAAVEREMAERQQASESDRASAEAAMRAQLEDRSAKLERAAPPPPPKGDDKEAPGGLGLTGSGAGGGGAGGSGGLGDIGTLDSGSGTGGDYGYGGGGGGGSIGAKRSAPGSVVRTTVASGPLPPEAVRRIILVNRGRLLACIKPPTATVASARLMIGADGKVIRATVAGISDAAAKCQTELYKKLTFPTASAATTVSVRIETN